MELKILSNVDNKLLNRKEITFSIAQENGTAKKEDVAKELCKKLNLNPDSTIIIRIDQGFGNRESSGRAHSYQTKEFLEKYESKRMGSKKKGKKEAKKEEPKESKEEKKE